MLWEQKKQKEAHNSNNLDSQHETNQDETFCQMLLLVITEICQVYEEPAMDIVAENRLGASDETSSCLKTLLR